MSPSPCCSRRTSVLLPPRARRGIRAILGAIGLVLVACAPDRVAGPDPAQRPSLTILDGGHGGNPHFFFLPPLAPVTTYTGIVDGSVAPQVLVQRGNTLVADLTATLPAGGIAYGVDWKVAGLTVGKTYRISVVLNAGVTIGYTEVVAVTATSIKDAVTGAPIPLVSGGKLAIRFRIEIGAVPDGISEVCEVGPPGAHTFSYTRAAEKAVKGKPVGVPLESSPITVESGACVPFWKSGWHDMMTVAETNLAPDLLLDSIAVTLVPSGGGSGVCGDPLEPVAYCPAIVMGSSKVKRELNPETAYRYTFYHRPKPQFSWYNVCAIPPHEACVSVELTLLPEPDGELARTRFVIRARNLEGTFGTIPWAAYNLGFWNMSAVPEFGAVPTRHATFLGTAGFLVSGDPQWNNYCALRGCPNLSWDSAEWDYVADTTGRGNTHWTVDGIIDAVVGCHAPPQGGNTTGAGQRPGYFQTCGNGWVALSFVQIGDWQFDADAYVAVFGWTNDGTPTACYLALDATSCAAAPPETD